MTANTGLYTNDIYHHQTLPVPNQTQKANEGQRSPTTANVGTTANERRRPAFPSLSTHSRTPPRIPKFQPFTMTVHSSRAHPAFSGTHTPRNAWTSNRTRVSFFVCLLFSFFFALDTCVRAQSKTLATFIM